MEEPVAVGATSVTTLSDLGRLPRQLRRRQARRQAGALLTYRQISELLAEWG